MKTDLLKIIMHYGVNAQQRQLAEEIADVMVLLNQFKAYYNIPNETILVFMRDKVNRQLERIKNEVKE